MSAKPPDHYATLGLDRRCTDAQIRTAYRLLAKQVHPDLNGGSPESIIKAQALNAAYEVLGDPSRRREYDRELADRSKPAPGAGRPMLNITRDIHLRFEEFLHGTRMEITVNDPGRPGAPETCELIVPPDTAPGTRFRVPRGDPGGFIIVRVKARPDFRFKVRGSDLRCDLKISSQRAVQGGPESVRGPAGKCLRLHIPAGVARGETIRLPGEGLPKVRGGRGELQVRIIHTPEVKIRRSARGY